MIKGYAKAQAAWEAQTDGYELEEDPEEVTYCPDCKGVNSCSCDEQYEAYKERKRNHET